MLFFLSVCLLCSGVPLTLQCRGFGLSIAMLFSLISSEIYPLNTDRGIHGHKLHRDNHSMFDFFFFFPFEVNIMIWRPVAVFIVICSSWLVAKFW